MVSQKPAGSTSRRKQEHHQYVTPGPESQSLIPATWQFAVVLPIISEPASDFEQLEDISSTIIRKIINEKNEDGDLLYQTVYEDGSQEWVCQVVCIYENNRYTDIIYIAFLRYCPWY